MAKLKKDEPPASLSKVTAAKARVKTLNCLNVKELLAFACHKFINGKAKNKTVCICQTMVNDHHWPECDVLKTAFVRANPDGATPKEVAEKANQVI